MSISPTDIITIWGQRGCGKSYLTRALSAKWRRKVVFDRMREWTDEPGVILVRGYAEFSKALETHFERDFTIVYQFPEMLGPDETIEEMEPALHALYRLGTLHPEPCLIVLEEVQNYAPTHYCPPALFEIIMTGRHAGLALIANSQRPASVSAALRSQCSHVFVGQLYDSRDIAYVSGSLGQGAERARTLEKHQFLWFRPGTLEMPVVKV